MIFVADSYRKAVNERWSVFAITAHLRMLARVRFFRATKKSVRIVET